MVSHLKWINLPINNKKLMNLGDLSLLLLPAWISVALIEWVLNFRNFFFSSTTTSTFIKNALVSRIKWPNLPINNEKLTNLRDPGLLLLSAWIFRCGLYIIAWHYVCFLLDSLWFLYYWHIWFDVISIFSLGVVVVVVLHFCSVC